MRILWAYLPLSHNHKVAVEAEIDPQPSLGKCTCTVRLDSRGALKL